MLVEVPLYIVGASYDVATLSKWAQVWKAICMMAYDRENSTIFNKITTIPGNIFVHGIVRDGGEAEHSAIYSKTRIDELSLDFIWSQVSKKYSTDHVLSVVPEFISLHVPRVLFQSLGVRPWFEQCFPNCRVTFWDE